MITAIGFDTILLIAILLVVIGHAVWTVVTHRG
jgi:hypothetical protein